MQESSPAAAAIFRPRVRVDASERIEGSHPLGAPEIEAHDDDRHDGEGGGERDIARRALMGIDRLADEEPRRADDLRDDVVAQRQREGEDRAGDDARQRERKDARCGRSAAASRRDRRRPR